MNLSKRTAERMLKNIEMQLQGLAQEQQAMNGNVGGQSMRKGGRVKMHGGGDVPGGLTGYVDSIHNSPWIWQTAKQKGVPGLALPFGFGIEGAGTNFGRFQQPNLPVSTRRRPQLYSGTGTGNAANTAPVAVANTAPVAVTDQNLSKIPGYGLNNPIPGLAPTIKPGGLRSMPNYEAGVGYQPKGGGFDWNSAMGLLPGAFNTLAGVFSGKPDMLNPQEFQNPYEDQSFAMMPDQFRVDDMLGDNRNAYATYLKNVNSTGNSRGERMANYGSGMNRMNADNTRAWALKNNQENVMRRDKAMMRNDQGVRRAGVNLQVRDMNDQNQAYSQDNRMDYLGAAASAFGNYGTLNRQMANQRESEQSYIDAFRGSGLNQFGWFDKSFSRYGSPNATNTNSLRNRTGLSKPTMEDLMRLGILPKYATQTNRVKGI